MSPIVSQNRRDYAQTPPGAAPIRTPVVAALLYRSVTVNRHVRPQKSSHRRGADSETGMVVSESTSLGTAYKLYGPNIKGQYTMSIQVDGKGSKPTNLHMTRSQ